MMVTYSTKRTYEWDLETIDKDTDDILDHTFLDKPILPNTKNQRLVLVRDSVCVVRGLLVRLWAYVEDGRLPEFFENSFGNLTDIKVPKKFHKELKSISS